MPIVAAVLDVLLTLISAFFGVLNSLFEYLFLTFKISVALLKWLCVEKKPKNKKANL